MRQALKLKIGHGASPEFLDGVAGASRRLNLNIISARNHIQTDFWKQCVRDTTGRWEQYTSVKSKSGFRYFFGRQSEVDFDNVLETRYLEVNIEIRKRLFAEMPQVLKMNVKDFEQWLRSLHADMIYKHVYEGNFPRNVPTHTPIVRAEIIPIASLYNDPYAFGRTKGPNFAHIPAAALPKDLEEGDIINHYYPLLQYKDAYLKAAHKVFCSIVIHSKPGSIDYLRKVSYLFQLLINLHLFVNINSSLYMNLVNALLEVGGISGIEHGLLDFVAMRLQPDTFAAYFIDQLDLK